MKDKIRIKLRESISSHSDELSRFVEVNNMSSKEFAIAVVNVFNKDFGSHNANDFIDIIVSGIEK
jgi:hypothetical protein